MPLWNARNTAAFLDNMWDAVYIVDRSKVITHWNKAAEALTGYAAGEVIGRSCGKNLIRHHCDSGVLCALGCPLAQTIADGKPREAQVSLTDSQGASVPVFVRIFPLLDEKDNIAGAGQIFRAVTAGSGDEAARLLTELDNLAHVDPLTKAARRNYGESVLDAAVEAFRGCGRPFGVLLLDLDEFKRVNDTLGHQAGDHTLFHVAETVRRNLRASDLLIRWGGDEFLVVVPAAEQATLQSLGDKLCELLADLTLHYADSAFSVSVSTGGALARPGEAAASIVARADKNMYAAKEGGKNRCVVG